MIRRNNIYRFVLVFTLLIISLGTPVRAVKAQGATLNISGLSEVPDDQTFDLDLSFDSPAELISLKIVLDYDPAVMRFESIDSPYLSYDVDGSSGSRLTLRTTGAIVPSGEINLAVLEMLPLNTGSTRVRVVSVSAFAAGDLIVRADATQSHVLSVVAGGSYIPVPSTTVESSTPETTASAEPENTTQESEPSLTKTIETTVEETTSEETSQTSESVSDGSDMETTVTESIETNMSSTTAPETSTISSDTTVDETTEVDNTNVDDSDNDSVGNGFRIVIPIILLLLVVSIITTAIMSRRKQ